MSRQEEIKKWVAGDHEQDGISKEERGDPDAGKKALETELENIGRTLTGQKPKAQ